MKLHRFNIKADNALIVNFFVWPLSAIIFAYLYMVDSIQMLIFIRSLEAKESSYAREELIPFVNDLFYYHYEMYAVTPFQYYSISPTGALIFIFVIEILLLLSFKVSIFRINKNGDSRRNISVFFNLLPRFFLIFCITGITIQAALILASFHRIYATAYLFIHFGIASETARKSLNKRSFRFVKVSIFLYIIPFILWTIYVIKDYFVENGVSKVNILDMIERDEIMLDQFAIVLVAFPVSLFFHYWLRLMLRSLSLSAEKLLGKEEALDSRASLLVAVLDATYLIFATLFIYHFIDNLWIQLVLILVALLAMILVVLNFLIILWLINHGLPIIYDRFGRVEVSTISSGLVNNITKLYEHLRSYIWLYVVTVVLVNLGIYFGIHVLKGA